MGKVIILASEEKPDKQKITELARNVIKVTRNQLLINLRFLDAAMSRPEWVENEVFTLATDGREFLYEPVAMLRCFKNERAVCARNYLHMLLHCVFRHMFVKPTIDHELWNLACDIAVEYSITCLGIDAVTSSRESRQTTVYMGLRQKIGKLTAEKIYFHFQSEPPTRDMMDEYHYLFSADDHTIWYIRKLSVSSETSNSDGGANNDDDRGRSGMTRKQMEDDWKEVSERMQMEMENFTKGIGKDPGALIQNLREVNRERYDYTEFLKKFAVSGEMMIVNPDEFDYIFYTYGLELYDNIPLIEPLEYKEVKRIRDFVIAIDTSGSVCGSLVQSFVQKTYNILKSTESFFSKVNIHIIQCDAAIQEDIKITTQQEFDDYIKDMKLRGFGGTDFRPVFSYVNELIAQKEFTNLKGMIYFTDGYGVFPSKMPEFTTAFVFIEGEDTHDVPPWAIKLVLGRDEI